MVAADAALPERGLVLVTGPSRSGKSRWAEHLAAHSQRKVVYVATGPTAADDSSWAQRVSRHQRRRPEAWRTLEVGGALQASLVDLATEPDLLVLIDSLGTWVAAHLDDDSQRWQSCVEALLAQLDGRRQLVLLVCEEVGWGVVPATAIGGLFRDRLGEVQQQLMAISAAAWLVVQGRALDLHALSVPVP
jgi:adenosylcobinamide kinase/adenosylcobinamide-phosphate guanylyltransferase